MAVARYTFARCRQPSECPCRADMLDLERTVALALRRAIRPSWDVSAAYSLEAHVMLVRLELTSRSQ